MIESLDSRLENLVNNWFFLNNDIRMMFMENDISFEELVRHCDRDELLSMTRMKNSMHIPLTKPQVKMIFNIIGYQNFIMWNGDRALADDPTQWNTKDLKIGN